MRTPAEGIVDLVGHHRGELPQGRHLLRQEHPVVGPRQLLGLFRDTLLEGAVPFLELSAGPAQLVGHVVPGLGHRADLVPRRDRDPALEIALGDPAHGQAQPLDRLDHERPDQAAHQEESGSHGGREPAQHLMLRSHEGLVHRLHGELDVEDPQHPLAGGVGVARGGALRLVVDWSDDSEHLLA